MIPPSQTLTFALLHIHKDITTSPLLPCLVLVITVVA